MQRRKSVLLQASAGVRNKSLCELNMTQSITMTLFSMNLEGDSVVKPLSFPPPPEIENESFCELNMYNNNDDDLGDSVVHDNDFNR